jgi:uncharacterized SAM-dependent methyltransferase
MNSSTTNAVFKGDPRLIEQEDTMAQDLSEILEGLGRSHKYTLGEFRKMAALAGFHVEKVWTDPAQLFSVQFCTCR